VCAEHLGVEACGGVDGVEGVGGPGRADSRCGGVEVGANLHQPSGELAGIRSPIVTSADVEVDVLPLAVSEAAQASGVLGEERTKDFAVPSAEQLRRDLDRAGGVERFKDAGKAIDAEFPGLLRGVARGTEEGRRFLVVEPTERCTVARGRASSEGGWAHRAHAEHRTHGLGLS
jgi:hypothetical protein